MIERSINARALVRLIPETHHKPPVLRGLVDDESEAALLAEIEGLTSSRLIAEREGMPELDRRELAFVRRDADLKIYGQTHINAAFTYTRSTGNRFNGPERGAWYCAYDSRTSAAEVGYHRTRELTYMGIFEDTAIYRELLADFTGTFPDISDEGGHPALDMDPATGYPAGQALALELRKQGYRGLLYPSVRLPASSCFVAFDPQIIQNVRPGASWRFVWSGSPEFSLECL